MLACCQSDIAWPQTESHISCSGRTCAPCTRSRRSSRWSLSPTLLPSVTQRACQDKLCLSSTNRVLTHANIVQRVKTCYKIKIDSRDSKCYFYGFLQHQSLSCQPSKTQSDLIAPLL